MSRKPGWNLLSDSYLSGFMWVWLPKRLNAAGLGLEKKGGGRKHEMSVRLLIVRKVYSF